MESEFSSVCDTLNNQYDQLRSNTQELRSLIDQVGSDPTSKESRMRALDCQKNALQIMRELTPSIGHLVTYRTHSWKEREERAEVDRLREDLTQTTAASQNAQLEVLSKERGALSREKDSCLSGHVPQQDITQLEAIAQLEERERSILQMEQEVADCMSTFRDYELMLKEEMHNVESILRNIEQEEKNMITTNYLERAMHIQSMRRKRLCVLGIVLFIVVLIIVIALSIHFGLKGKKKG